jgi:hypothetical protein
VAPTALPCTRRRLLGVWCCESSPPRDEANGVAELEPVGTHPDFRRLGLARAVSIAALRTSGARTGVVYSYGGTVASEPYDSIGLRRQTRHVPFRHRTTLE